MLKNGMQHGHISTSPACSNLRHPRESQWTPWGLARLRSGTNMHTMSPGSADTLPDNSSIVFVFCGKAFTAEGALGPPLFIPSHPTALGSLKEQEPHCGPCPLRILVLAVPLN